MTAENRDMLEGLKAKAEAQGKKPPDLGLLDLERIEPEEVDYLWHPYLPKGKLVLLEGDPDTGKSWLALGLAAGLSKGVMPDGSKVEPGRTIYYAAEDGVADTLVPRLILLGADRSMVKAFDEPLAFTEEGFAKIASHMRRVRPSLIVFDPLSAYLPGKTDMYRANEVRAILKPLTDLAKELGCTILVIRHLNKGGGKATKAIYRGAGSVDFTAAARSVLMAEIKEDTGERAVFHIKGNLSVKGAPVGYVLDDPRTVLAFTRAPVMWSLTDAAQEDRPREQAREWLRRFMIDRRKVRSTDVLAAAETAGHNEKTLKRAKTELPIEVYQDRNGWWWEWTEGKLDLADLANSLVEIEGATGAAG